MESAHLVRIMAAAAVTFGSSTCPSSRCSLQQAPMSTGCATAWEEKGTNGRARGGRSSSESSSNGSVRAAMAAEIRASWGLSEGAFGGNW